MATYATDEHSDWWSTSADEQHAGTVTCMAHDFKNHQITSSLPDEEDSVSQCQTTYSTVRAPQQIKRMLNV